MYLMIVLVENDNWEEIVGRCHAHEGTKFSIGSCIPSKYMNQGKSLGSSFHQKSLSYQPNHFSLTIHSGSHGLGPWVTKIIPGFARFYNGFCWKYEHTSCCISSGVARGPCCMSSGHAENPCCMSSNWDPLLFSLLFLSFSFFSGLWAFMVLLNFMNWAFFC